MFKLIEQITKELLKELDETQENITNEKMKSYNLLFEHLERNNYGQFAIHEKNSLYGLAFHLCEEYEMTPATVDPRSLILSCQELENYTEEFGEMNILPRQTMEKIHERNSDYELMPENYTTFYFSICEYEERVIGTEYSY